MYSVIITTRDLEKSFETIDICENYIEVNFFKNLLKLIIKEKNEDIDFIFKKFLKDRAISPDFNSETMKNIKCFVKTLKLKKELECNLNFYLVEKSNEKIVQFINYWFLDLC
jgi:hypothetical protein